MRESLRGALLSVLFLGGLAVPAVPATADDKMKCKGKNCTDETTVTGKKPDPHRGGNMIGWGPVVPRTSPPPRPPARRGTPGSPYPPGNNWSMNKGGQDLTEEQLSSLLDGSVPQ